jgi:hypothetical protein
VESCDDREYVIWYYVDLTFNDGYVCKVGSSLASTALTGSAQWRRLDHII